jgi:hypothetical protein
MKLEERLKQTEERQNILILNYFALLILVLVTVALWALNENIEIVQAAIGWMLVPVFGFGSALLLLLSYLITVSNKQYARFNDPRGTPLLW